MTDDAETPSISVSWGSSTMQLCKSYDVKDKDMILTCGQCRHDTFYISERGNVCCTGCRCLMAPPTWTAAE